MAHDVHSFVADKLSEVVLTKHHRQRMMVFALTLFGIVFLGVFSGYCFYKGQTLLATTLAFYTGFGLLTVWLLTRWRTVGLVCLSAIIYSLSPNSTAKCDTRQYQAASAISLKTIAG
ncbi:hypothetical protein L9W73_03440, partial [Vibrio aestuarianus]|nr:hypothetical protein [Vibrio aestuarianus]